MSVCTSVHWPLYWSIHNQFYFGTVNLAKSSCVIILDPFFKGSITSSFFPLLPPPPPPPPLPPPPPHFTVKSTAPFSHSYASSADVALTN